jgi:hypothetical protein
VAARRRADGRHAVRRFCFRLTGAVAVSDARSALSHARRYSSCALLGTGGDRAFVTRGSGRGLLARDSRSAVVPGRARDRRVSSPSRPFQLAGRARRPARGPRSRLARAPGREGGGGDGGEATRSSCCARRPRARPAGSGPSPCSGAPPTSEGTRRRTENGSHGYGGESATRVARALGRKHPVLQGLVVPLAHRVMRWGSVSYELRAMIVHQ